MKIRRRQIRVAIVAVLPLIVAPLLAASVHSAGAATADSGGPLRMLGHLPEPATSERAHPGLIAGVDVANRRMYYVYANHDQFDRVVTYDLRPTIPKPIATGDLVKDVSLFPPSPYSVAIDGKRHQLVFITGNVDAGGTTVTLGNPTLSVYSDVSHKISATWNVATTLPGFYPFGVTYSAIDDRLYLVGEFAASQYGAASSYTFGSKAAGAVTTVVALNPANGALIWARPVRECQQALFTLNVGGLLARSASQDALYFACVTGGTATGQTYPGQAGMVRLHIDPKANDSATAAKAPAEFFPISGNYFNGAYSGIAAYDHSTDRFYLQSLAPRTPGAWVFDGRLSAWVGFVSAPSASDRFVGLNEGLGHLYIGTNGGGLDKPTDGILVADVRQTPVPAGEFQKIVTGAFLAADAGSRRLFVLRNTAYTTKEPFLVMEDTTPVTNGEADVDYDADTTNTPDLPGNEVSYALGAAGFGAESIQVGGTAGAGSVVGTPDVPGVAGGTRAVMSARLGGLDLRGGGAGASTQAALADINSVQSFEGQTGKPWPYPVTSCLDTGGQPDHPSYPEGGSTGPGSGTSTVTCDLGKSTVSAAASMGASGAGGTTVQRSAYDAHATRDTKDGAVVTTEASAEGVTFAAAGGITIRVARVDATSKSVAHGRPGTTSAAWSRDVDGIRITDQTGSTVFTAPGCTSSSKVEGGRVVTADTCSKLADVINQVLPMRFRISFPMPKVTATAKGAFAAVEQTDADYFQQRVVNDQGVIYRGDSIGPRPVPAVVTEVYNDSTERSRTVTVLAATQSNAIFTVTPPFKYDTGGDGSGGDTGTTGTSGTPGTPGRPGTPGIGTGSKGGTGGGNPSPQTLGNSGGTASGTQLQGYLFMRRSLRDAALLVLLAGLILAGAGTAWRRRRLVDVLITVPRKEAV
jgi:hypothetical protein